MLLYNEKSKNLLRCCSFLFICSNAFVFIEQFRKLYKEYFFNECLLQDGFQTNFSLNPLSADYNIVAPKIIEMCGLFNK